MPTINIKQIVKKPMFLACTGIVVLSFGLIGARSIFFPNKVRKSSNSSFVGQFNCAYSREELGQNAPTFQAEFTKDHKFNIIQNDGTNMTGEYRVETLENSKDGLKVSMIIESNKLVDEDIAEGKNETASYHLSVNSDKTFEFKKLDESEVFYCKSNN